MHTFTFSACKYVWGGGGAGGGGEREEDKKELSLAKNSHCELCGVRSGSLTAVVVNSISLAICSMVQFWYDWYARA